MYIHAIGILVGVPIGEGGTTIIGGILYTGAIAVGEISAWATGERGIPTR
jgi:hypothetical protein